MGRFDHVVITAANAAQAAGYRAQLAWRARRGSLDPQTRYHVVADPDGRRIGSLGATLYALRHLAAQIARARPGAPGLADLLGDQRIVICHSGGDSRRLPAYAAQGKVFTPLPTTHRGHPAALFDLIMANLEQLPAPAAAGTGATADRASTPSGGGGRGQVLIYVGDVLLTFDPAAVAFEAPGVVGVAYPGSIETGSRHGVYVADAAVGAGQAIAVRSFLQKPDAAEAHAHGAIDAVGRVLIDTGILSIDPPTTAGLLEAAGVRLRSGGRVATVRGLLADLETGRGPGVDLYEELTMALAPDVDRAAYRAMVSDDQTPAAHRKHLDRLFDAVADVPFHVNVLPYCDFFHIGSSREFLANIATLNRTAEAYGFANQASAVVAGGSGLENAFVYNTIIDSRRARAASGTLVEACDVDRPLELRGRNIVTGLPRGHGAAIRLRQGIGLVVLPVTGGQWAAVVYGLDDDFKGTADSTDGCSFLDAPVGQWLTRHKLSADDLWQNHQARNLWEARLWRVGRLETVIADALWMQATRPRPEKTRAWRRARRLSMRDLIQRVDHERLIAHRRDIRRRVDLARLGERLAADNDLPAADVVDQIVDRGEAKAAVERLAAVGGDGEQAICAGRVWKLAAMIAQRHRLDRRALGPLGEASAAGLEQRAFAEVSRSVQQAIDLPTAARPAGILHDQVVWATTPVRLDFCGGWSDTPPFCTERGGAVVNAAITLNGQYPVQAMAKLNEDRVIRLSSIDLGRTQTIDRTEQLLAYTNPGDWAALPKAALVLAGIGPGAADQKLSDWLDVLGGGIDLTIFSAVPKGSGLGTSSILGAAVLACLDRVQGAVSTGDQLIARTSALEQMLTTGGGWQDQVGGIVPGVKLIETTPGVDQTPQLQFISFPHDQPELGERLLLYFTGQKRLARNILQNVVGRYLARDPEAVAVVDQLKVAARQMKRDLDRHDIEAFAAGVDHYWQLKKRLDPGATNAGVERIMKAIEPYAAGRTLPGAGGGGFVFIIARDADAARKVRRKLERHPPSPQSRFFDFAVDSEGLKVTTL